MYEPRPQFVEMSQLPEHGAPIAWSSYEQCAVHAKAIRQITEACFPVKGQQQRLKRNDEIKKRVSVVVPAASKAEAMKG